MGLSALSCSFHSWLVLLVCILVVFVPCSSQLLFFKRYNLAESSFPIIVFFSIFDIFIGMMWLNLYAAAATEPGRVPPDWLPDNSNGQILEVKVSTQAPRFCRICQGYKPPRAHHCRSCGRCVLKMDHHCPWLNNCIGFNNHHYFLRFLFYLSVSSWMCLCVMSYIIYLWILHPFQYWYALDRPTFDFAVVAINFFILLTTALVVTGLSIFNFIYVLNNYTTIENLDKDRRAFVSQNGNVFGLENPYDLGWLKNIKSVLGESPFGWLLLQRPSGNGLSFKLRGDSLVKTGLRISNPMDKINGPIGVRPNYWDLPLWGSTSLMNRAQGYTKVSSQEYSDKNDIQICELEKIKLNIENESLNKENKKTD